MCESKDRDKPKRKRKKIRVSLADQILKSPICLQSNSKFVILFFQEGKEFKGFLMSPSS